MTLKFQTKLFENESFTNESIIVITKSRNEKYKTVLLQYLKIVHFTQSYLTKKNHINKEIIFVAIKNKCQKAHRSLLIRVTFAYTLWHVIDVPTA